MGRVMYMLQGEFYIALENHSRALQSIKSLLDNETVRGYTETHFTWVNTSEYLQASTLIDALQAWRWNAEVDPAGNIISIEFQGEKFGDDEILFRTIASYVRSGSFIVMASEDGEIWRWLFDGETVNRQMGHIVFD